MQKKIFHDLLIWKGKSRESVTASMNIFMPYPPYLQNICLFQSSSLSLDISLLPIIQDYIFFPKKEIKSEIVSWRNLESDSAAI